MRELLQEYPNIALALIALFGVCFSILIAPKPKSVPEANRSFQQQLEEATGFTITRVNQGSTKGWRWVQIHFTFKYNGYVTKSAFARAAISYAVPMVELKHKAAINMKAEAAKHKLNWNY